MLPRVTKELLSNVIRHTDAHNKVIEETEMWKAHEKQKEGSPDRSADLGSRIRSSVVQKAGKSRQMWNDGNRDMREGRGRPCPWTDRPPRWRSRSRSQSPNRMHSRVNEVPKAHMDREPKDNFWQKKLMEAENNNPDRWGHSGFQELYPDEFSDGKGPADAKSPQEEKTKKKKKHKKLKKHHKRKDNEEDGGKPKEKKKKKKDHSEKEKEKSRSDEKRSRSKNEERSKTGEKNKDKDKVKSDEQLKLKDEGRSSRNDQDSKRSKKDAPRSKRDIINAHLNDAKMHQKQTADENRGQKRADRESKFRTNDRNSRSEVQNSRSKDRSSRSKDRVPRSKDRGSRSNDRNRRSNERNLKSGVVPSKLPDRMGDKDNAKKSSKGSSQVPRERSTSGRRGSRSGERSKLNDSKGRRSSRDRLPADSKNGKEEGKGSKNDDRSKVKSERQRSDRKVPRSDEKSDQKVTNSGDGDGRSTRQSRSREPNRDQSGSDSLKRRRPRSIERRRSQSREKPSSRNRDKPRSCSRGRRRSRSRERRVLQGHKGRSRSKSADRTRPGQDRSNKHRDVKERDASPQPQKGIYYAGRQDKRPRFGPGRTGNVRSEFLAMKSTKSDSKYVAKPTMVAAQDDEELTSDDDDVTFVAKSTKLEHIPVPSLPERLSKSLLNQGRSLPPVKTAEKAAEPVQKSGDFDTMEVSVSVGDEEESGKENRELKMAEKLGAEAGVGVTSPGEFKKPGPPSPKDPKKGIEDKVESFMAEIDHVFGAPDLDDSKLPGADASQPKINSGELKADAQIVETIAPPNSGGSCIKSESVTSQSDVCGLGHSKISTDTSQSIIPRSADDIVSPNEAESKDSGGPSETQAVTPPRVKKRKHVSSSSSGSDSDSSSGSSSSGSSSTSEKVKKRKNKKRVVRSENKQQEKIKDFVKKWSRKSSSSSSSSSDSSSSSSSSSSGTSGSSSGSSSDSD